MCDDRKGRHPLSLHAGVVDFTIFLSWHRLERMA